MIAGPRCLNCGSSDMIVGGFATFHWRKGRWVEQRGQAELGDGAPIHCQSCGTAHLGNHSPPFDLEIQRDRFR